jgi:DNA polymerase III subunit delta'
MSDNDSWRKIAPAIATALEKAKHSGRIGQAYLLVGDRREQLECFAHGLARTASCLSPDENGRACGHCRNCQLWDDNAYSEQYTVEPESKSRVIRIAAMQEFDRQMWLSVPSNMIKIGFVVDAHCMNEDAQNTFLKTLEEPPERTMMLLETTSPQLLLPTIRSRCQVVLLKSNRVDYSTEVPQELFTILAAMHRGAGTRIGFNSSNQLKTLLAGLQEQAQEKIDANWDENWEEVSKGDKKLSKELDKMKENKVLTEYLRLRTIILECLQSWFQQRYLIANNITKERLPQQEFFPYMDALLAKPPSVEEAEADNRQVAILIRALRANVPESLCFDAFCLAICEKY